MGRGAELCCWDDLLRIELRMQPVSTGGVPADPGTLEGSAAARVGIGQSRRCNAPIRSFMNHPMILYILQTTAVHPMAAVLAACNFERLLGLPHSNRAPTHTARNGNVRLVRKACRPL
jgi:hypothetical protein